MTLTRDQKHIQQLELRIAVLEAANRKLEAQAITCTCKQAT